MTDAHELAVMYAVKTGTVSPVGGTRGGHCAFIEPRDWERVQRVCEAYQAEYPDG